MEELKTLIDRFKVNYGAFTPGGDITFEPSALQTLPPEFEWRQFEKSSFRECDVEKLLDEAADYLERALQSRSKWQELYERAFRTYLEISEGLAGGQIAIEEENAGILDLSLSAVKTEIDALMAHQARITELLATWFNEDTINRSVDAAGDLAWRSANAPDAQRQNIINDSRYLEDTSQRIQKQQLLTVQDEAEARLGSQSTTTPLSGLSKQSSIVTRLQPLTLRRRELDRALTEQKLKQSLLEGGAFHYPEQLLPLSERYFHDFQAALPRMYRAASGLRKIYNFQSETHQLPSPAEVPKSLFFDKCLQWVHDSVSWLITVTRQDRLITASCYLSSLWHSPEEWRRDLDAGSLSFTLSPKDFGIPESFMTKDVSRVTARLRGLGVEIVPMATQELSLIRRIGFQVGDVEAFLGRVLCHNAAKQLEIITSPEYWNLNPFTNWKLDLTKPDLKEQCTESIQDIVITIAIALRN